MKLEYEDMISGEPIYIDNIGHFRSPQIKELNPTSGIGIERYNMLLNIISWDKDNLLDTIGEVSKKKVEIFKKSDSIVAFDIIILMPYLLNILHAALSFFICESVVFDAASRAFFTYERDGGKNKVGKIDRSNYDSVRNIILQLNFRGIEKDNKPIRHSSKKSEDAWQKAQKFIKKSRKPKEDSALRIGNVISKLSALPTGYTLFNIYDLTIFQLYDQFTQYAYLRAMDLTENVVATHGGSDIKFKFEDWMKPPVNI